MARKTNVKSMKDARYEGGRKDWFSFQEGDTIIYVCPPCREDDERCFYTVPVHYSVGPDNKMTVCLNPEKNKLLAHPFLQEFIAEKDIDDGCPVCEAIAAGRVTGEAAEAMKVKKKYLWNVIPIAFRRAGSREWRVQEPYEVVPIFEGWQIYDGLLDLFGEHEDITDFDGAIFARVNRTGTGKHGTAYKVSVDANTLKSPKKLSTEMRKLINAALEHGASGDMYQMVGKMIYDRSAIVGFLSGVVEETAGAEIGEDEEEEEAEDDGPLIDAMVGDREVTHPAKDKPEREPGEDDEELLEEDEQPIDAESAEVGAWYSFKGREGRFEGIEDNLAIFTTSDGKRIKAKPSLKVTPLVAEEDGEEEVLEDEEVLDDSTPFDDAADAEPENVPPGVKALRKELDKKKAKRAKG